MLRKNRSVSCEEDTEGDGNGNGGGSDSGQMLQAALGRRLQAQAGRREHLDVPLIRHP